MAIRLDATPQDSDPSNELSNTPPRTLLLDNLETQTTLITALFTLLASSNPNSRNALAQLPIEIQQLLQSSSEALSHPAHSIGKVSTATNGNTSMGFSSSSSSSASVTQSAPHPIDVLHAALSTSSNQMHLIRKHLTEHQRTWARVEAKKRKVMELEERVKGLIMSLERGKGELEGMVKVGRGVIKGIEQVREAPIPAPALLAHAHALARHSSAPMSSLLTPIDRAAYMPWPTEAAMRMGLLFQMQGSMSGVGLVESMGTANGDVEMADASASGAAQQEIHREDNGRRYDPEAVYSLDLNSDSEDE